MYIWREREREGERERERKRLDHGWARVWFQTLKVGRRRDKQDHTRAPGNSMAASMTWGSLVWVSF